MYPPSAQWQFSWWRNSVIWFSLSFITIGVIQNILLDKFPLYKIEWKTFWTVPIWFTLYVWPGFDGTANKQKLLRFGFLAKMQTIINVYFTKEFHLIMILWSWYFISSDRSSYSASVLLLVRRQLFQILSISANIFSFSCW